jgi:hypothetical protein
MGVGREVVRDYCRTRSTIGAVAEAGGMAEPPDHLAAAPPNDAVCIRRRWHLGLAEFGSASSGPQPALPGEAVRSVGAGGS